MDWVDVGPCAPGVQYSWVGASSAPMAAAVTRGPAVKARDSVDRRCLEPSGASLWTPPRRDARERVIGVNIMDQGVWERPQQRPAKIIRRSERSLSHVEVAAGGTHGGNA